MFLERLFIALNIWKCSLSKESSVMTWICILAWGGGSKETRVQMGRRDKEIM